MNGRDAWGQTVYAWPEDDAIRWLKGETLDSQPYPVADPDQAARRLSDFPCRYSDDSLDDVATCVDIARRAGLDTVVLDQARPDIELNVSRVIVPGLPTFWRRLAPGRLYDVPVSLGWLPQAGAEIDLNPIAVFHLRSMGDGCGATPSPPSPGTRWRGRLGPVR